MRFTRNVVGVAPVCAVVLTAIGCASTPITTTPPLLGLWGGSQFELTAYPDSARVYTTCSGWLASGPLVLDDAGSFQAVGTRHPTANDAGGELIHIAGHLDTATAHMSVTYSAAFPSSSRPDTGSVQLVKGMHGDFSGFLCAE